MAKRERYIAGLDIGSCRICAVIGEISGDDSINVIGIGECPSKGIRKGAVVDLDATVEAIRVAADDAAQMAGVELERAYVAINGPQIKGVNSRGVVRVAGRDREIGREDVDRVIERARDIQIPADHEVIHVLPQEFTVDDQVGITNPKGMCGTRLEANVHMVTGSVAHIQNLLACVNRAGVEVADLIVEHLAGSTAVLTQDERELGVAYINMGAGTTNLAVFYRGAMWHCASGPVGGYNFTNDIAIGLNTTIEEAEKIKKHYGSAAPHLIEEDETVQVPSKGSGKPRLMARRILCDIIRPRAMETFELLLDEVEKTDLREAMRSGLVLTGGASVLPGLSEIAGQIFNLPVRTGHPTGVGSLQDLVSSPSHSTAAGLLLYPRTSGAGIVGGRYGSGPLINRTVQKIRTWFTGLFL